jgi:hypothetical protein
MIDKQRITNDHQLYRKRTLLLAIILTSIASACQPQLREDNKLLINLMKREPMQFKEYIKRKDELEIQIIYTRINRDANNKPSFKSFYFNVDTNRYFYPASTVKLPMALLALEKLNQLKDKRIDKYTPMLNDSVYAGQLSVKKDTTSESSLPSVSHYVKKILIVSDNDAHNRLYEFLGQRATNEILASKGYHLRLLHRLERGLPPDQNRHTEAVRFIRNDSILFSQPMLVNDSMPVHSKQLKGTGYMKNDSLINQPFDFSYKNFYSLLDQQTILKSIIFPTQVGEKKLFDITEDDRQFVLKHMSQLPTETLFPNYALDSTYYPAYCKFLMYGEDKEPIPDNIRIFNKVGDAYGYLIDNAYIVDFENGVEFMLSAVISTNTDGVFNDGKYEYKKVGYPFMKNLGQLVYNYELKRKRKHNPDLSSVKFEYPIISKEQITTSNH